MKILLYGHGGSGNHGCEAIVRTSSAILGRSFSEANFLLASERPDEDRLYLNGFISELFNTKSREKNLDYWTSLLHLRLTGDYVPFDIYHYKSLLKRHPDIKLALSIGGDNYCYGDTSVLNGLNNLFRVRGLSTALWGCSIEPDLLSESVVAGLKNYSIIIAREGITYDALHNAGITNVYLYPDPAFVLSVDTSNVHLLDMAKGWVGINLSPYISRFEGSSGATMASFRCLINYLIDNTDLNIAFIPHVIWSHSDDRIPLRQLYEEFSCSGRVIMLENDNAERLKGIISKCRFMVAARTHASIAAYSSCVPTLVVGYSVKAKGIAQDIFGSYEDYVLPVQNLRNPGDLIDKFRWIMDHETEIRNHLEEFMPGYIARAWEAGEALKKI